MKRVSLGAARRYARALLDVALARGEAETLRGELHEVVALFGQSRELAMFLAHPAVAAEKKKRVVAALWTEGRASELLRRLLVLLAEGGRCGLLPAIEGAFGDLWNAHRGVAAADVVSATPLTREQREAITAAMAKATNRIIETNERVDPAILGGVLVTVAGRTYDGTVRTRLKALRECLASGA
jgi:F-type H+-transporting ATPase subunit delta